MATDQETDPDEIFFTPGLLFFHASKQNSCHGHGVPGTTAELLLQAGGLGLQHREGLFGFKIDCEVAPKVTKLPVCTRISNAAERVSFSLCHRVNQAMSWEEWRSFLAEMGSLAPL